MPRPCRRGSRRSVRGRHVPAPPSWGRGYWRRKRRTWTGPAVTPRCPAQNLVLGNDRHAVRPARGSEHRPVIVIVVVAARSAWRVAGASDRGRPSWNRLEPGRRAAVVVATGLDRQPARVPRRLPLSRPLRGRCPPDPRGPVPSGRPRRSRPWRSVPLAGAAPMSRARVERVLLRGEIGASSNPPEQRDRRHRRARRRAAGSVYDDGTRRGQRVDSAVRFDRDHFESRELLDHVPDCAPRTVVLVLIFAPKPPRAVAPAWTPSSLAARRAWRVATMSRVRRLRLC